MDPPSFELEFTDIPLFGREEHISQLRDAYNLVTSAGVDSPSSDKVSSGLVVVTGHGGTGKSALVKRTFHVQVALKGNEGHYFVCGKFDQIRSSQPFSVLRLPTHSPVSATKFY